jgi:hypothetical protein
MRTTLDLGEDVLRAGKSLARQRGKSLGKVITELSRIGLAAGSRVDAKHGFPVFTVDPGTGPISLEDVNRSEDEG